MSFIGPFKVGEPARIALMLLNNGIAVPMGNPIIRRVIGPNMEDVPGYPKNLEFVDDSPTYSLDVVFDDVGPYLIFLEGYYGTQLIEQIAEAMVETRSFGYPRIEAHDGKKNT